MTPDHWCGLALLGWLRPRAWGWAPGGQGGTRPSSPRAGQETELTSGPRGAGWEGQLCDHACGTPLPVSGTRPAATSGESPREEAGGVGDGDLSSGGPRVTSWQRGQASSLMEATARAGVSSSVSGSGSQPAAWVSAIAKPTWQGGLTFLLCPWQAVRGWRALRGTSGIKQSPWLAASTWGTRDPCALDPFA